MVRPDAQAPGLQSSGSQATEGRQRVAIERVQPSLDCGRFPIKRTIGETLVVTANVFADGHDVVQALLVVRPPGSSQWQETPLVALGNDEWRQQFMLDKVGRYEYAVVGWIDAFETWHRDLKKRIDAGQDIAIDLRIGAQLVGQAAQRAKNLGAAGQADSELLRQWEADLAKNDGRKIYDAGAAQLEALVRKYPDRELATQSGTLAVVVDRERARFSSWYELFPRSCGKTADQHGTLRDVAGELPRLAEMGFDVVYLPPIHPIGVNFRKGKNNATVAQPGEVGSPWAIGGEAGGHTALHPDLGTLDDFGHLIKTATNLGIDIALDIAFQCSPDHPYVKEHPQWFRQRPDGTIQYAENPPKKYQDIYPFDFETSDWQALWRELTDVVLYWCEQGVRVFRVDNPHTKAFAFWEFLISEVKAKYPESIFLSEAFTRPKIMYRLAKLGFSQSYTYFTWRNTKAEFIDYLTELTETEVKDFFRPNLWPNTPDILPEHLQVGGRPAFIARLALAATLGASYGIYGPAFENLEHLPRDPGSEEYLDSEKYQIRHWDFTQPGNLAGVLARVNRARKENRALQWNDRLKFHPTDNDQLLCYSKRDPAGTNLVVMVVNLNFHGSEHGFIMLPLVELGLDPARPYQLVEVLKEETFTWTGERNFVKLDPQVSPAHIFVIKQP